MMRRLPCLIAAASLLLAGCGTVHRYKGSRVNWAAPVFLESGRIGVAQISWDEYEVNCSSYPGSGTCTSEENLRMEFIAFSPDSGTFDTLFSTRDLTSGWHHGYSARASYYPPRAYLEIGMGLLHDFERGTTRRVSSRSAFSRSGRHLVDYSEALDLTTGEERSWIPWRKGIGYYDDVEEKLLLNYNVLYIPATGLIDSSRPVLPLLSTYRYGTYVGQANSETAGRNRLLFAPIDSFNLEAPRLDTVFLTGSDVTDFDPPTRRYLRNVLLKDHDMHDGADEIGFALGSFDGGEKVYRASDYHPRLTRRGGSNAQGL